MSHARFTNRQEAGRLLGEHLRASAAQADRIVLGLPRGGVPVAFEVAQALEVPLDVLLVRKLGLPGHEELAMGAVTGDGHMLLQADVVDRLHVPMALIESVAQAELARIRQREKLYRDGRPPADLHAREVILVDDGLATGSTMLAAIHAVRQSQPARIVVAVPVGAVDTCRALAEECDALVCLRSPEPFYAVGVWYRHFDQVSDAEVQELLAQVNLSESNLPSHRRAQRRSMPPAH